jgi:hypothetical protein
LRERAQPDPAPSITDGECRDASRATDASINGLQTEREWLQGLLVHRRRGCRRQYRGKSESDRSSSEVTPTDQSGSDAGLTGQQERDLRDPEVRKNIEILAALLSDVIDLDRRQPLCPEVTNRLLELLRGPHKVLCLETLLDTRRSVEELLVEHADLPLLRQRTAGEYAEEEATLPTWRRVYGDELPEILRDSPECSSCQVQESTRVRLQRLVAARFWLYRPLRARRALRFLYLRYFCPVLLLTGLLFGFAIGFQHQVAVRVVLLAAAAGASGATVSGMLKFRDEVRLGAQVREFLPFYLVQAGIGAVFGLFIALVFAAGWLSFKPGAAGVGVLAFAAGFSEPVAIGIVAKMTERASL